MPACCHNPVFFFSKLWQWHNSKNWSNSILLQSLPAPTKCIDACIVWFQSSGHPPTSWWWSPFKCLHIASVLASPKHMYWCMSVWCSQFKFQYHCMLQHMTKTVIWLQCCSDAATFLGTTMVLWCFGVSLGFVGNVQSSGLETVC